MEINLSFEQVRAIIVANLDEECLVVMVNDNAIESFDCGSDPGVIVIEDPIPGSKYKVTRDRFISACMNVPGTGALYITVKADDEQFPVDWDGESPEFVYTISFLTIRPLKGLPDAPKFPEPVIPDLTRDQVADLFQVAFDVAPHRLEDYSVRIGRRNPSVISQEERKKLVEENPYYEERCVAWLRAGEQLFALDEQGGQETELLDLDQACERIKTLPYWVYQQLTEDEACGADQGTGDAFFQHMFYQEQLFG